MIVTTGGVVSLDTGGAPTPTAAHDQPTAVTSAGPYRSAAASSVAVRAAAKLLFIVR